MLEGELITGEPTRRSPAGCGCTRWTSTRRQGISPGDIVVVGNRADAQRLAIELGARSWYVSNGMPAVREIVGFAREHGMAIIASPLDSYVSAGWSRWRRRAGR